MPKSCQRPYYTAAPNLMRLLYITLPSVKVKYTVKVLYELAILLTHFMKEYLNSFNDIQFFFLHFHQYLEIYKQ